MYLDEVAINDLFGAHPVINGNRYHLYIQTALRCAGFKYSV
jgi:hypothetical protein